MSNTGFLFFGVRGREKKAKEHVIFEKAEAVKLDLSAQVG